MASKPTLVGLSLLMQNSLVGRTVVVWQLERKQQPKSFQWFGKRLYDLREYFFQLNDVPLCFSVLLLILKFCWSIRQHQNFPQIKHRYPEIIFRIHFDKFHSILLSFFYVLLWYLTIFLILFLCLCLKIIIFLLFIRSVNDVLTINEVLVLYVKSPKCDKYCYEFLLILLFENMQIAFWNITKFIDFKKYIWQFNRFKRLTVWNRKFVWILEC